MSDYWQAQIRFDDVFSRGKQESIEHIKALNWEWISAGAMSNAKALCTPDRSLEYAQHRVQPGQPIADFRGIEWKLADMATKVETLHALTHATTKRGLEREDRVPDRLHSSMVKLQAAQMVDDVDQALPIHGARVGTGPSNRTTLPDSDGTGGSWARRTRYRKMASLRSSQTTD